VREHLLLVAVAHGVADAPGWVSQVLDGRMLTERADALPSALSSGQMQALLLACALVRPRDLLLLDEPEQRLDPDARRHLADLLKAELADGVAVLLVTHHTDLAMDVADRVVVLEDGRILKQGATRKVLAADFAARTAAGSAPPLLPRKPLPPPRPGRTTTGPTTARPTTGRPTTGRSATAGRTTGRPVTAGRTPTGPRTGPTRHSPCSAPCAPPTGATAPSRSASPSTAWYSS
ncbi:energy-coupling factor ABC transporter ATP-binding protein, partial [Streptomyces sp. NRRL S-495]|uniref:energy-coupling factor ABC transporter ATP-binding protein n=1 Tax=Streptomyces sp. NRRL S-495 TaxID=1609133 RepID=UPI003369FC8D